MEDDAFRERDMTHLNMDHDSCIYAHLVCVMGDREWDRTHSYVEDDAFRERDMTHLYMGHDSCIYGRLVCVMRKERGGHDSLIYGG